ncbi:hypothetical protein L6164_016519 [Bauhinia variegata]|uniref:Uncharacterized protein n=1 Tax=Bauhinia variegata TaxID=167791 RepID=A0ACB9NPS9_BAUVA|nr:hypothetical protein L6164_016519 [Bauhinia variegata]
MVIGKSQINDGIGEEGTQHRRLVTWGREEKSKWSRKLNASSWAKQLVDPVIGSDFEVDKMEILVLVALECVQEDKDARPTMRQVVEMLQNHEND